MSFPARILCSHAAALFLGMSFLAAPMAASMAAQTAYVTSGQMTVAANQNFSSLLASNGITMTYTGYLNTAKKQGFKVTGGGVGISNGAGSAFTRGSITFAEGSNVVLLADIDLLATQGATYLTAEVSVNGADQGRFSVFQVVSDPYPAPTPYGEVVASGLTFRINPAFVSEFADYIPINGFDPTSNIGTFGLDVILSSSSS